MGFVETGLVFDKVDLAGTPKNLLLALADRADSDGVCWPSIAELAHRTSQSERNVKRVLALLKERGLIISQQRRYRAANGATRQASNVYKIDLAGIIAGKYDTRPPWQTHSSSPGGQFVTQEIPGCQNGSVQGDTGVPRRTCHKELSPLPVPDPLPPSDESDTDSAQGQEPGPGGAVAPAEDSQPAASGEASPAVRGAVRTTATEDEWDRVFACLPSRMAEELPPAKIPQIASYLAERIDAGWQPGRIRAILDGRALPEQVGNMTGLVIARLRDDVPVDGAPPSREELRERRLAKRDAELSQYNTKNQPVKSPLELTEQEREEAARQRREMLAKVGIKLGRNKPGGGK